MVPIEMEQNCEIGNKIFQSLLGMDAIFVLSVQTDVSPQANYKINAMKIMFDLHTFKQKKVYQNMRAEQEKSVRFFLCFIKPQNKTSNFLKTLKLIKL